MMSIWIVFIPDNLGAEPYHTKKGTTEAYVDYDLLLDRLDQLKQIGVVPFTRCVTANMKYY